MKRKLFTILRIVIFTAVILSFFATAILYAQEPAAAVAEAVPAQSAEGAGAVDAAAGVEAQPDWTAVWDAANGAYAGRDYARAVELYDSILAGGHFSARLYYNLGNACFKSGDIARAVLNYRRALRLAPADGDARYNLSLAEAQTKDNIAEVPEFFLKTWSREVRDTLGCTAWSLLSILLFALAVALALLFLLGGKLAVRKAGFYGTAVAALLFVVATWFAISSHEAMLSADEAVVMATAIPVKSSPDRSATDLFVLHAGTQVRIIAEVDEWREVVIADGKRGWVEASNIEVI